MCQDAAEGAVWLLPRGCCDRTQLVSAAEHESTRNRGGKVMQSIDLLFLHENVETERRMLFPGMHVDQPAVSCLNSQNLPYYRYTAELHNCRSSYSAVTVHVRYTCMTTLHKEHRSLGVCKTLRCRSWSCSGTGIQIPTTASTQHFETVQL